MKPENITLMLLIALCLLILVYIALWRSPYLMFSGILLLVIKYVYDYKHR